MKPQCLDAASAEKEISFGSLHLLDTKKGNGFLNFCRNLFFFFNLFFFLHIYNSSKTAKLVYKKILQEEEIDFWI